MRRTRNEPWPRPCSLPLPRPALAAEGEGGIRAGAIVGTCEEMCPAPERERRGRLSDIQVSLFCIY